MASKPKTDDLDAQIAQALRDESAAYEAIDASAPTAAQFAKFDDARAKRVALQQRKAGRVEALEAKANERRTADEQAIREQEREACEDAAESLVKRQAAKQKAAEQVLSAIGSVSGALAELDALLTADRADIRTLSAAIPHGRRTRAVEQLISAVGCRGLALPIAAAVANSGIGKTAVSCDPYIITSKPVSTYKGAPTVAEVFKQCNVRLARLLEQAFSEGSPKPATQPWHGSTKPNGGGLSSAEANQTLGFNDGGKAMRDAKRVKDSNVPYVPKTGEDAA